MYVFMPHPADPEGLLMHQDVSITLAFTLGLGDFSLGGALGLEHAQGQ